MLFRRGFWACIVSALSLAACGGSTKDSPGGGGVAGGGTGGVGAGGAGSGGGGTGGVGAGGVGTGGAGTGAVGNVDPTAAGTQPPPDPGGPPTIGAQITGLAFQKMFMGETDRNGAQDPNAWKSYGYNLDGIISTTTGSNHCRLVANSPPTNQRDGDGGIDNSFGANIVPILNTLTPDPTGEANARIADGDGTMLIRLNGLLGMPNETQLPGSFMEGAPLGSKPMFNGTDKWPATAESFVGGKAKVLFPKSYVANGTWVSGVGTDLTLPIVIAGQPVTLEIKRGVLTADVTGAGSQATGKNGVLAGVIATGAFVTALKQVFGHIDPSLCNSATADGALTAIRQASDIMIDGTNGDSNQECNGISIGIGFEAAAVFSGGIAPPVPPTPDPCPPGN